MFGEFFAELLWEVRHLLERADGGRPKVARGLSAAIRAGPNGLRKVAQHGLRLTWRQVEQIHECGCFDRM